MHVVCAYCRGIIHERTGAGREPTSHGMCAECAEHFGKLWDGMSFCEYLDTLPAPILVVDGAGRVIGANRKIASLLGRDDVELRGIPPGQAFACVWSRLPEGCGGTVHCRECTIRSAVRRVRETGEAIQGLRAWIETSAGVLNLRISVTALDGLVKVTVERETRGATPRPQARA